MNTVRIVNKQCTCGEVTTKLIETTYISFNKFISSRNLQFKLEMPFLRFFITQYILIIIII